MKIAQKIAGIFILFIAEARPIQYIKLWEATRNQCESRAL